MAKKYILKDDEKALVMKAALRESAALLENDWGDPFKDRELPAELVDRGDSVWDAADEHFFKCIKKIAMYLRTHDPESVLK